MSNESFLVKNCPACGNKFRCVGDDDCWCEDIRLHQKQTLQIIQAYNDCLCPACLRSFKDS